MIHPDADTLGVTWYIKATHTTRIKLEKYLSHRSFQAINEVMSGFAGLVPRSLESRAQR